MEYFIDKNIRPQLISLTNRGGHFQKAADRIKKILYEIKDNYANPFKDIPQTNHGESRVKHCVKYDIPGFCRLITVQSKGICVLIFCGSHDECDKWLEKNRGYELVVDQKNKVTSIKSSTDITISDQRISNESDFSQGKLYAKLKKVYQEKIDNLIPFSKMKPFLDMDAATEEDELIDSCSKIDDNLIQSLFFDVFASLLSGDVDNAKNCILKYEEEINSIDTLNESEVKQIQSGSELIKLKELEKEFLQGIFDTKNWLDWMVFLHPDQKDVVEKDFKGSARLLGVSGSGKTCVIVHRAIKLAEKYPGESILILTLNHSLASLIKDLVDKLLQGTQKDYLKSQIKVTSFWEECKEILTPFKDKTLKYDVYDAVTAKHGETIEEIWQEFYKGEANNNDAEVMFSVHQTLLARSVYPQDYIKQEFDWIRSVFSTDNRQEYLEFVRSGRSIPFNSEDRALILQGLKFWDDKMEFVGLIDYLGIANSVYKYISEIESKYRCILVDEVQDFGTLELKIIRKLTQNAPNDLFICGDISQQVYTKHHGIKQAGINILPEGYLKIIKNYRNSREILEAAYSILESNKAEINLLSDEFEILLPEYANFSSPNPFLRSTNTRDKELSASVTYLKGILDSNTKEKGCIAICGLSIFDIAPLAKQLSLPVLDGKIDLSQGNIFLSDLEQTKGFEFDRMIIINCSDDIIPNPSLPPEESYREIAKLYVAMTRAKRELIISYTRSMSQVFKDSLEYFNEDKWIEHVPDFDKCKEIQLEAYSSTSNKNYDYKKFKGKDLLYLKEATGISRELQNKVVLTVNGKSVKDAKGRKEEWPSLYDLLNDVRSPQKNTPALTSLFGPVVYHELEELLSRLP